MTIENHPQKTEFDDTWYWYLTGEYRGDAPRYNDDFIKLRRKLSMMVPAGVHCFECGLPLAPVGAWLTRLFGVRPSSFSPHLCNICEKAARESGGGAEARLSLLFADVRGSTSLAASQSTGEYRALIQRFYKAATDVLVEHNAMVNRLMGDQVIGIFAPRFTGEDHARKAIMAAKALLQATGHGDPDGAWIPVGAGVHTGDTYVGVVGNIGGVNEIAVLGNAPNLTARLSSEAGEGELLISAEAAKAAQLEVGSYEERRLALKGFEEAMKVYVGNV